MAELKHISNDGLKKALKFQEDNGGWTFFNEREFMENLLQTRFNFLITVYAIFCNVYFATKGDPKIIILFLGLLITLLMFLPIYRIYKKVDILLNILYELGNEYTSTIIAKELKEWKIFRHCKGVNCLIGIIIPIVILLSFIVGIIYYFYNKC